MNSEKNKPNPNEKKSTTITVGIIIGVLVGVILGIGSFAYLGFSGQVAARAATSIKEDVEFSRSISEDVISAIQANPELQATLRGPQGEIGRAGRSPVIQRGKDKSSALGALILANKGGIVNATVTFPPSPTEVNATLSCELYVDGEFNRVLSVDSIYQQANSSHPASGSITGVVEDLKGQRVEWVVHLEHKQEGVPEINIVWNAFD